MNMTRFRRHVLASASLALGLLASPPARAASLQKVNQSDWWSGVSGLPSYVNMYIYVPDRLATKPPIVIAPHHCQGNGQGTYNEMSSLVSIANSNGFIIIFPEATGQNCWDAGSMRSLTHNGSGDTGALVQMVKYTLSKYSGDANRVYSVGTSSGGIMTEALLGVYPDVFMAGVSVMGVPCGCWAEGYSDVTGTSGQWSGPCAGGNVTKTAQQWGDLVRSFFPRYTGHRPRLQHWHGTTDTTINYKNMAEDIKQWTNVLDLAASPTGMDTPKSGTTRQFWKNACGYTVYEAFSLAGVGHTVPFDGNAVAAYFGLATAAAEDPETAACPGAVPGGNGAGGASGSGGSSGTGGATGSGGAGGRTGAGGSDGGAAGRDGGTPDGGGVEAGGTGGSAGTGGSPGSGGSSSGTGGSVVSGSGGSAAPSGSGGSASGGAPGGGGSSDTGGSTPAEGPSSGCGCSVRPFTAGPDATAAAIFLALAATLGVLLGRPDRRRRRRFR
jgi:acetylxylan esterase